MEFVSQAKTSTFSLFLPLREVTTGILHSVHIMLAFQRKRKTAARVPMNREWIGWITKFQEPSSFMNDANAPLGER